MSKAVNVDLPARVLAPCECDSALEWAAQNGVVMDGVSLRGSRSWDGWQHEFCGLLTVILDGPVHVVIVDASDDRYIQMQIGHGRAVLEISATTTLSDAGVDTEWIAYELIEGGFDAPARTGRSSDGSPNWAIEIDPVSPGPLAQFVVAMLRHRLLVDVDRIRLSSFVIDRPCAACTS